MKEYTLLRTTIDTGTDVLGQMSAVAAVEEKDHSTGGIVLFEYADNPVLEKELREVQDFYGTRDIRAVQAEENPLFRQLRDEMSAYLAGSFRERFTVALKPVGSAFQREVWDALQQIPYGTTESYGEQTRRMNKDIKSVRAVAGANGKNKLPVLIPCHRVIGSAGKLTGYSGGIERKRFLLTLEQEFADK